MLRVILRSTGFGIKACKDVLINEGLSRDVIDLVWGAFKLPQIAVSSRVDKFLDRAPVLLDIDQQWRSNLVPVPSVVPLILMVGFDSAGIRIDGEQRSGIEVVAFAHVRRPWSRIARSPVHQIEFRVVVPAHPSGCAAVLPRVAGP